MRHLYAVLAVATVVAFVGQSRSAQAASPKADIPEYCLAVLDGPMPLDDAAGNAERYALVIRTLIGKPGNVSGTLALYTATQRYDVPFANAIAFADQDRSTQPTLSSSTGSRARHATPPPSAIPGS